MVPRHNTVLTFNSDTGQKVRLNIPRADMTLTAARAQETMEAMIAGGIIINSGGVPASIHGAELVTTKRANLVG